MQINKLMLTVMAAVGILSVIVYKAVGFNMQSHQELPKISVVLGETIDSVEQHSTYPFRKKMVEYNPNEVGFFLTRIPMLLEYRDEQHGFSLPPTIFLGVDFEKSKANYIRVSPQLELLDLVQITQLAKQLIHRFNQAGWQLQPGLKFATPDRFAEIFVNRQVSEKLTVAIWTLDDKEMILRIMRNITREDLLEIHANDKEAKDLFLLDLEIYYKSF